MTQIMPEHEYSVEAWNEMHHYSITEDRLTYRFGGSDVVYSLNLEPGSFSLTSRWQTHRNFRKGLILVLFPVIAFGAVYAKEHAISGLGVWLYVHAAMLVLGVFLVARFRAIYRGYLLRTSAGDELLIYCDPESPKRADEFISEIKALV